MRRAFSILELLIAVGLTVVLLALLTPMLLVARNAGRSALCANNLRQIGVAYQSYLDTFERFPTGSPAGDPQWTYGGVEFTGDNHEPAIAADRPINAFLHLPEPKTDENARPLLTNLFRCPADRGVGHEVPVPGQRPTDDPDDSFYRRFGTSYLANGLLQNPASQNPADPVSPNQIAVATSRLLVLGDPVWYYALKLGPQAPAIHQASWHGPTAAGNMLAADGSVRFLRFDREQHSRCVISPWPETDKAPR